MAHEIRNTKTTKPTEFELFTGGKFPEMAVFYNIAFLRVAGIIYQLQDNSYSNKGKKQQDIFEKDKSALENSFKDWVYKDEENRTLTDEKVFSKLKDYLWKGYSTAKNSSGSLLEEKDKRLIIDMLKKLEKIRNFQSHIFHDNSVLAFPNELKKYIEDFHREAKLSFVEQYPNEVKEYDKWLNDPKNKKFGLFSEHEGKHYITAEGRTFFLSFFVTRGEMARFLQQRKGSKRNDSDKYKLKHKIYRYYTHRDGAARQHYGHEETILSGLSPKEQEEILLVRQASKIISYLNDQPPLCTDTKLFPLINNGKEAQTSEELINYCVHNKLLPDCKLKQYIKVIEIPKTNERQEKLKENIIEISYRSYQYHMGKADFNKVLVSLVNGTFSVEYFNTKLSQFIAEREHFAELMLKDFTKIENETGKLTINDELDQYYRFKLRNEKMQCQMGAWLEKIEKGNNEKTKGLINELNEKPPIEINYYDLFFEENQKPRMTDRFVEFAVKYLIDFKIVPDWYWMVERFETVEEEKEIIEFNKKIRKKVLVNKRIVQYSPTIPDESRLSVTDDGHVTVGIYTQGEEAKKASGKAPKHKFVLGHRVIKNLLIAHFDRKENMGMFFTPIISDLEAIRAQKGQNDVSKIKFQLLEDNAIPISYKRLLGYKKDDHNTLREKAVKRMDNIISTLKSVIPDENSGEIKVALRKAEKNRQIMRCYTFFDWQYDQSSKFKFLRKDEYQKMSVYHYCLDKRNRIEWRGELDKKDSYYFLIEKAVPHMPNEIKQMLAKAKNIDDLLILAVNAVIEKLEGNKANIQHIKGKNLQSLLNKVGVSNGGEPVIEDHIPFNIHPILVLRKFYENELAKGDFSLSAIIRNNTEFQDGLHSEFYEFNHYTHNYLPKTEKNAKKITKYIIGEANDQLTKDALLWNAAKRYLSETRAEYRAYLVQGNTAADWKVSNLRKTTIEVDFDKVKDFGMVKLLIKFHQLDDYLLMESKPVIKRILWQVLQRFKAGYKPIYKEEITKLEITHENGIYCVPYDEVFKEMQRINNDALGWAKAILKWEESVLNTISRVEVSKLAKEKQDGDARIDFRGVCGFVEIDEELKEKVINLRNMAFHAEVPANWTYWQKAEDTEICQLLKYTPKTKYDYENRQREQESA